MIDEGLYTKLTGSSGVTALVGTRVYPNVAPPDTGSRSHITYQQVDEEEVVNMAGSSGLMSCIYDIFCWSRGDVDNRLEANRIADAVRNAIATDASDWGSVTVQGCFPQGRRHVDQIDPESEAITALGVVLRFQIWHSVAVPTLT